jgi:cytochrome P450
MLERCQPAACRQIDAWHDGQERDVHQDMMELTLQIACKTLFGADVASDLAIVRDATAAVGSHFVDRMTSMLFVMPDWVPTPGNLRYQRAVGDLDALVYRIIRERNAGGNESQAVVKLRPKYGLRMTAEARRAVAVPA